LGGANDPVYEGANFAVRNNVIVVTVNYRLGMLGFLYESALHTGGNTALDNSGNFATLDLIKGLNWVNNNIATFGGNKNNITVGGQSAGCIDTWGLIQSPLAAGKFQKAICMSGLPNMYPTALGQGFAGQMEDGLLMDANPGMTLAQADALRLTMSPSAIASLLNNATAAQIMMHSPQPVNPGHFTDGVVIPSMTSGILVNSYNKVPMINGSVDTEGSLFVAMGGALQVSQQTLWSMMNTGTPTPSDAAIVAPAWQQASGQPFSSSPYAQGATALGNMVVYMTDMINIYLQDPLFFPQKMYRYHFQWANQPQPWKDIFGSEHALDVPFVFGNFPTNSFAGYAWTSANQTDRTDLSHLMNSYYANFLWNGDPNNTSNNPHPYSNASNWAYWSNTSFFPWTIGQRMMFNATLGQANAGSQSYSSQTMTLFENAETFSSILSLPAVAFPFVESFLIAFIPQSWLTELGLSIP
jgi:para-nitrobenzyl esterase